MAFREVRMLPVGVRVDVVAEFGFSDHAVGGRVVRLRVDNQCLQAEFVLQIGDHVLGEVVFRLDEKLTEVSAAEDSGSSFRQFHRIEALLVLVVVGLVAFMQFDVLQLDFKAGIMAA